MKKKKLYWTLGLAAIGIFLLRRATKVSIPAGATVVRSFDLQKYLGQWYEIARLDYHWEKGLDNVSANYSMNKNGTVRVVNRGYDYNDKTWKESTGKARFVNTENEGRLKVSFWGPFYSGYNVVAIEGDYKYALVFGNNLRYMWILSRKKTIPADVKRIFLRHAHSIGFDTEALVWTHHNKPGAEAKTKRSKSETN